MSTLSACLQGIDEAGICQLNCGADELRDAVHEAGFVWFDANLAEVHGKAELLAVIAEAVHAPDWFGANWDALADTLGDLSWVPSSGYVLLLRNVKDILGQNDDSDALTETLVDTVAFWKLQGKPFWVFFC